MGFVNDVYIDTIISGTAPAIKTGQTVSRADYDDGYYQAGRLDTFFLLKDNNFFGNKQRFTGITGGYYDQTLAGWYNAAGVATTEALAIPLNIVLDWNLWDRSTGDVLGVYRSIVATNINWATSLTSAVATSVGSFTTGWRLWNRSEANNFMYVDGTTIPLNYAPLNISFGGFYWTSTNNATNAIRVGNGLSYQLDMIAKTSIINYRYVAVRNFNTSEL